MHQYLKAKRLIAVRVLSIALVSVAACRPTSGEASSGEGKLPDSAAPQNGVAAYSPSQHGGTIDKDANALSEDIAEFASTLYQGLSKQNRNFMYSPFSISEALAMTYAGARSRTEQQMAKTLSFHLSQKPLHLAFRRLHRELTDIGQGAKGQDGGAFRLNIANALWGQKNYGFLPDFLGVVSDNYGAGFQSADFVGNSEASRKTINDWVTDKTSGKITDLFPSHAITSDTRLVLANAIYFNAAWATLFPKGDTHDDDFKLLDSTKARVPMMALTTPLGYAEFQGGQAVELKYDGGRWSMVILSPQTGALKSTASSLRALEEQLSGQWLASIMAKLSYSKVQLTMPRFKCRSAFSLNRTLAAMGMPDAFDPRNADFSGMTGKRDLKIDHVMHKTFILVDETGTEAAAATGVSMGITSLQPEKPPIIVKIDHPFIYAIRHLKTGAIVFMGRVVDPRGAG